MRNSMVGEESSSCGLSRRDFLCALTMGACCIPFAGSLSACSDNEEQEADIANGGARTITDLGGNSVSVPSIVDRYAVLWAAGTDIMAMLDGLEHAVMYPKVSEGYPLLFKYYPKLTEIESCDAGQVSHEELISKGVQVVFMRASDNPDLVTRLSGAGIAVVDMGFTDYDGLKNATYLMADVLNSDDARKKAQEYSEYFDAMLAECDAASKAIPEEQKPTAIVLRETASYQAYGRNRFAGQWVERCGGNYVLDIGDPNSSTNLTKEQLLEYDPEFIFFIFEGNRDDLMSDASLKTLSAVKSGRVYDNPAILNTWSNHGSEAVLQFAWALCVFHGQKDGLDAVKKEATSFYERFYGLQIDETDLSAILGEG